MVFEADTFLSIQGEGMAAPSRSFFIALVLACLLALSWVAPAEAQFATLGKIFGQFLPKAQLPVEPQKLKIIGAGNRVRFCTACPRSIDG